MNDDLKISKKNVENVLDLTPLQEGILYYYLKDSKSNIYFVQLSLKIEGEIIIDYFKKAWSRVVDNNEMLRTVFRWEKLNKPVQIILKVHNIDFRYYDLSEKESTLIDSEFQNLKLEDYTRGFDLREVPFRLTLCKFRNDNYNLLISNHHILYDGWSNGIILNEFKNYYGELVNKKSHESIIKAPFKNYIKNSKEINLKGYDFWKDYLSDYEVKYLFRSKNNISLLEDKNECYKDSINEDIVELLIRKCKSYRLTISDVLYNAWGILLSKYSGEDDILFGTTISGRNIKLDGVENMVGLFINTIPFRLKLSSGKSLINIVKETAGKLRNRLDYENIPLQNILDYTGYRGEELFESIFVVENYPINNSILQKHNDLTIKSFSIKEETNYKLTVSAFINQEIEINFNYSKQFFESEIIENLGKHYIKIVENIICNGSLKIESLDLLSDAEKYQILYEFNNSTRNYPKSKTIHKLFEDQVEQTPDKIAVAFENVQLTFSELNKRSNQLSWLLKSRGAVINDKIGLMLNRSEKMLISIFGILKAGCCYVPFDIDYPTSRTKYILDNSGVKLVLIQGLFESKFDSMLQKIILEEIEASIKGENNLDLIIKPSDLSYILYTSGSTGNPKGVQITHASVVNQLHFLQEKYPINQDGSYLLKTSYCFDVSVSELFGWILGGGHLMVLTQGLEKNQDEIIRLIQLHRITHINFVPTVFRLFLQSLLSSKDKELSFLKYIMIAGEVLLREHVQDFFELNSNAQVENLYGPTEATVYASHYTIPKEGGKILIGKPIPNYRLYILGRLNMLQPIGVQGELFIEGVGLAKDYLNNQRLTEEKFIDNPYSPGERIYRTGDLARWLPDGNIEFIGRLDHQVKIRGFRVELGEIENALLKHDFVRESAVLARERNGDKYLCAYVVLNAELTTEAIRVHLSGLLPEYMIPSYFIWLEAIPLTRNGKVDRRSLPEPEIKAGIGYIAPSTLIESKVSKIWSEVLSIAAGEISIDVNFFKLGGHSLKATQLVSRIHKEFGVRLELQDIFQYYTIQEQSELIRMSTKVSFDSIPKADMQDYYRLSSAQKRLYLLQQMDLVGIAYNMPGLIRIPKGQDRQQLEVVFKQLIQRHESFRTYFDIMDNLPIQRIKPKVSFLIKKYQIKEEDISKIREDFIKPFDLCQAPLLRVAYLEVLDGDDLLLIDMHHIICDEKTHSILSEEFECLVSGETLPPLSFQYKDYSEWQNSTVQQERIRLQEEFWLNMFSDEFSVLTLPSDYSRPVMHEFEGAHVNFILSQEETRIIRTLGSENGLTLYQALLSVFSLLLSKLSGQTDIIIGTPVAGRNHADLEKIVGMFVNTLAIRNEVKGDETLSEFLVKLKHTVLEALNHQEYPFEELVEKVSVNRDTSRNPLFDVMFNLLNKEKNSTDISMLENQAHVHVQGISKFDLTLTVVDYGEQLLMSFDYSSKLFKAETIERYIKYFKQLVNQITGKSKRVISEIELISPDERHQLLYEFNNTRIDFNRNKTIHQLFEEQVERTPDRLAIVYKNQSISYRELNFKSNQLASLLLTKGIKPKGIVGLLIDRSIEMIIGVLGILKSGGVYLPMDIESPLKRIRHIIKDSGATIILNHTSNRIGREFEVEELDLFDQSLYSEHKTSSIPCIKEGDLAYLIYTSGSTGKPKGVVVRHRNLVNLVNGISFNIYRNYQETLHVSLTSPIFFDASVKQIFPALTLGHNLMVISADIRFDASKLVSYYLKRDVQIADGTPFQVRILIQEGVDGIRKLSLKQFILGGDELKIELAKELFQRFNTNGLKVSNVYGPTECTDVTTINTFTVETLKQERNVSIGRPISNYSIYILGESNNLQPIGVPGELCISGEGLSIGYLNNQELTSMKFIDHPFNTAEKLYRTGDLARWLSDGNIEFLGRIDHQVKIRGFRIELGEIESSILKRPDIKESLVLVHEENEDKYICAYIVSKSKDKNPIPLLKEFLSGLLPNYMIPSCFVAIDKIPLTPNGKINRNELIRPSFTSRENFVPPSTVIEKKLVKVWSEILLINEEEISVNSNFFDIKGNSLKAAMLSSYITKVFNKKVTINEVFKNPYIKNLAIIIDGRENSDYIDFKNIEKREYYSLTFNQKRIWFLNQMDPITTAYNMCGVLSFDYTPDYNVIQDIILNLIIANSSLRTGFINVQNEPVQIVVPINEINIEEVLKDLREESDIENKLLEFYNYVFDLKSAPLVKFVLYKEKAGGTILAINMHHIITDGWSMRILKKEFIKCYEQIKRNLKVRILKKYDYIDYAGWQTNDILTKSLKSRKFWQEILSTSIELCELPRDYTKINLKKTEGRLLLCVEKKQKDKIIMLTKDLNTSTFTILFSAFLYLLYKITGVKRPICSIINAGREHYSTYSIIGFFVNPVLFNMEINENLSFKLFIEKLHLYLLQIYDNQYYPIEALFEEMKIKYPKIPISFNMLNIGNEISSKEMNNRLEKTPQIKEVKYDFELYVEEYEHDIELNFVYNSNIFAKDTIQFIGNQYFEILDYMIKDIKSSYTGFMNVKKKVKLL